MNKPTKWQSAINVIHRNWCRDNGYPTNWYRARYGRPTMHKRKSTSEMKKYLPIKIKDVEHLVNSYEKWYGTFDKEGYKYVIEQLNFDDIYYNDILSSLHNFKKGGEFYLIERHKRDEIL